MSIRIRSVRLYQVVDTETDKVIFETLDHAEAEEWDRKIREGKVNEE